MARLAKQFNQVIRPLLILGLGLLLLQLLQLIQPDALWSKLLGLGLTITWAALGVLFISFLLLQTINNFRFERSFAPHRLKLRSPRTLTSYQIHNSLEVPGNWHKAQLHAHSNCSYDGRRSPEQLVKSYQDHGYQYLVITDHNRSHDFSQISTVDCLVLPGIELTIPALFWPLPLGKHLVMLNPPRLRPWNRSLVKLSRMAKATDSLLMPAHLSWRGGAGTGRWYPKDLLKLKQLRLLEIESPHSRDPVDRTLWTLLNLKQGPSAPVWGVAVDDTHKGSLHKGWIMVKTERIDRNQFLNALRQGAFYASTGPTLELKVEQRTIVVQSPEAAWLRFINAQNQVVAAYRGTEASYQSQGDEGFIRVEAIAGTGRTAWSQPMWLLPNS